MAVPKSGGSVGNLKNEGNKGNNVPFQLRSLQLLGQIVQPYAERIDSSGAPAVIYIGYALPSASETKPVWRIKKITDTGTIVSIVWADGNADFDNVWADRATLTYI